MKQIRLTRPSWRVFAASYEEIANFNRIAGSAPSASVPQDGVFLLSVYTIPSQWLMEPMEDIVKHVLASLGSLRSCNLIENGTNMSRYQVEYFNKRHAAYAFSCLGGFKLDVFPFFCLLLFAFCFLESAMLILVVYRVFVSMSPFVQKKTYLPRLISETPALAPLRAL